MHKINLLQKNFSYWRVFKHIAEHALHILNICENIKTSNSGWALPNYSAVVSLCLWMIMERVNSRHFTDRVPVCGTNDICPFIVMPRSKYYTVLTVVVPSIPSVKFCKIKTQSLLDCPTWGESRLLNHYVCIDLGSYP